MPMHDTTDTLRTLGDIADEWYPEALMNMTEKDIPYIFAILDSIDSDEDRMEFILELGEIYTEGEVNTPVYAYIQ